MSHVATEPKSGSRGRGPSYRRHRDGTEDRACRSNGRRINADFLSTYEIPFVFGNPGTTETTFLAAIAASKATYVLLLHESSAVGVAAGYRLIMS
jgi:hypothetical protein